MPANPATSTIHPSPDHRWRWLAAASIIGNILINFYSNTKHFNGQSMGQVSARYPTLLTPAGYAFSIWGLIFLSLVAYAGWQLLPAQKNTSLPDAIARPLTLASVATAAWVVLFAYEWILPSVGVMVIILGSLIVVYGRVRQQVFAGRVSALVSVPFSLYLGWISVASFINITIGLQQLGLRVNDGQAVSLTLALLALIVVAALLMSRIFRDLVYPLVIAWALVAIWLVRLREMPDLGWFALAGAVVASIFGIAFSRVGGRKAPWELAAAAAVAAEAEIAARKSQRVGG